MFLGGGGGRDDSLLLDRRFAELIPRGQPILYLPLALDPARTSYASAHAWASAVFNPLGIEDIVMWETMPDTPRLDPRQFAAVYIGGGNTYRLLQQIRTSGFDATLSAYVKSGGIISGGSAGAIILGTSIETAGCLGDRNEVAMWETDGLDLLDGYSVWPHFQESHAPVIAKFVQERHQPIIALSERAGAIFHGEEIEAVGYEPVHLFHEGGQKVIAPGSFQSRFDQSDPSGGR